MLVFPAWRDNPYLNMLSLAARADGCRFLGATTFPSLLTQIERLAAGDIVHIHWTSPILQNAPTRAEADLRLKRLRHVLSSLSRRRIRLIWTIHNKLPHELAFREEEIELYRQLASHADRIHVMAPDTRKLMADTCDLPADRIVTIAHPSYVGVYDGAADRPMARRSFDLRSSDHAVLFLGQIRPYKGVEMLVDAVSRADRPDERDTVLLLAGAPKDGADEMVPDLIPPNVRAHTHFGFVPDGAVARWFMAADVAVFPYRAILNSGSVHLAATFRVPVIIPDEAHLRSQFGAEPWVAFFDTSAPADSIAAMLSDDTLFADVGTASFDGFLARVSPWTIAREYARLLGSLGARGR